MKRIVLWTLTLMGVTACDEPTRPAETVVAPPAAATAAARQFTVRNLGTLGGTLSEGRGINEQGEVVGFATLPSGNARAFLWRAGQGMRGLGTLGGASSEANGINDRSEVVGESLIRPGSAVFRAFLWSQDRGMRGLGTLGGELSVASAINNRR
jgi:probable HAF family extracellular repeat protein